MRITPLDIRKQEFRKVMRGVDSEEVYAFLTTVAEEYEAALSDNKALRERVLELDDKVQEYRTMERTLRDTLLTAERATANAKQNAQREADLIIKEAQIEAEKTLRDIKGHMMRLRQEVQTLQRERESYLTRMKMLADSFSKFIESEERHFNDDEANDAKLMAEPEGSEGSPSPPDNADAESTSIETAPEKSLPDEKPSGGAPSVAPALMGAAASLEPKLEKASSSHQETPSPAPAVSMKDSLPKQNASPGNPQSIDETQVDTEPDSSEKPALPDLNAILDRMVKEQKEILNETGDAKEPERKQPAAAESTKREWSLEQLRKDITSE